MIFSKSKGNIEKVIFHKTKPYVFIMTKKSVIIYNLAK